MRPTGAAASTSSGPTHRHHSPAARRHRAAPGDRDQPRLSADIARVVSGADRRARRPPPARVAEQAGRRARLRALGAADRLQRRGRVDADHFAHAGMDRRRASRWCCARPASRNRCCRSASVARPSRSTIPLVNAWATGDVVRPDVLRAVQRAARPRRGQPRHRRSTSRSTAIRAASLPRDAGTAWASSTDRDFHAAAGLCRVALSVGHLWPVDQVDYWARPDGAVPAGRLHGAHARSRVQRPDGQRGHRARAVLRPDEGPARRVLPADVGAGLRAGASALVRHQRLHAAGSALPTISASTDFAAVNEGVAVCLTDGTIIYRRITDISASGGNSLVTVDAAWGVGAVERERRPHQPDGAQPLRQRRHDDGWRTPLTAERALSFQQVFGMSFAPSRAAASSGDPVQLFFFKYGPNLGDLLRLHRRHGEHHGQRRHLRAGPDRSATHQRRTARSTSRRSRSTPTSARIAELFRVYPPAYVVSLIIRQGHIGDPDSEFLVIWAGRVVGGQRAGRGGDAVGRARIDFAASAGPEPPLPIWLPASALRAAMPLADKASKTVTATVSSVNGASVTLVAGWNGAFAAAKFLGGCSNG
jgi:hypothetical protein